MRSQVATFVFAIVFGAETSAAHAQLLPRRDLSYSIAKTIAETAIESCTARAIALRRSLSTAPARP